MEALQLSLLSSAEMPAQVFSVLENKGVYTGARLRAQRPEVYERCLVLLQEGVTPLAIEDALGIEHRTVEAVAAAHSIPIQTSKRRMAERFRFAADRMIDRSNEARDAREAKDLMVAACCAADKWQLLEGQPTSRSAEVVEVKDEDWNGWIDCAVASLPANGAADQAPAAPLEATASDSQSGVAPCADDGCAATGGGCIPEAPSFSPQKAADGGGGGQALGPAATLAPDASGERNFPTKGAE